MITLSATSAMIVTYGVKGLLMEYKYWSRNGVWYWSGGGSNGTGKTQEEVETMARRWLRDGQ